MDALHDVMVTVRRMGPLAGDHPLVTGDAECPGCNEQFFTGEYVTLVQIGPGADPEARAKARDNRPHNAVAIPAHWACVTGDEA